LALLSGHLLRVADFGFLKEDRLLIKQKQNKQPDFNLQSIVLCLISTTYHLFFFFAFLIKIIVILSRDVIVKLLNIYKLFATWK